MQLPFCESSLTAFCQFLFLDIILSKVACWNTLYIMIMEDYEVLHMIRDHASTQKREREGISKVYAYCLNYVISIVFDDP